MLPDPRALEKAIKQCISRIALSESTWDGPPLVKVDLVPAAEDARVFHGAFFLSMPMPGNRDFLAKVMGRLREDFDGDEHFAVKIGDDEEYKSFRDRKSVV